MPRSAPPSSTRLQGVARRWGPGGQAVAIVNGEEISVSEFERRLNGLAAYARAAFNTPERKKEYLDSVVIFEMMADEAEHRGLQDHPAVVHEMKEGVAREFMLDHLNDAVSISEISDADIERAWRERQHDFITPERRRAAVIKVLGESLATAIAARLDAISDREERLMEFRRASSTYSMDEKLARAGGEMGMFSASDQEGESGAIVRALFDVQEVGEIAGPYAHDGGYILVSPMEKVDASSRTFEQVRDEIRGDLVAQKRAEAREALVVTLRDEADIALFLARIDALEPPDTSR